MSGSPATNARRIRRPSSVRIGMFWRFGSLDERAAGRRDGLVERRVEAAVDLDRSVGRASTYVERSFV